MTDTLHVHEFEVKFQDVDASGTVSMGTLFTHVHDAYAAFLAAKGLALASLLAEAEVLLPLVHVEADVRAPMRHGDALRATLRCTSFSSRAFTLSHEIRRADGDALVATCTTVHVSVDPKSGRPSALPERLRAALGPPFDSSLG